MGNSTASVAAATLVLAVGMATSPPVGAAPDTAVTVAAAADQEPARVSPRLSAPRLSLKADRGFYDDAWALDPSGKRLAVIHTNREDFQRVEVFDLETSGPDAVVQLRAASAVAGGRVDRCSCPAAVSCWYRRTSAAPDTHLLEGLDGRRKARWAKPGQPGDSGSSPRAPNSDAGDLRSPFGQEQVNRRASSPIWSGSQVAGPETGRQAPQHRGRRRRRPARDRLVTRSASSTGIRSCSSNAPAGTTRRRTPASPTRKGCWTCCRAR